MTGSTFQQELSPVRDDVMAHMIPDLDDMSLDLDEIRDLHLNIRQDALPSLSLHIDTLEGMLSHDSRVRPPDVSIQQQDMITDHSAAAQRDAQHIHTCSDRDIGEIIVDSDSDDDHFDMFEPDKDGDSILHLAVLLINTHVLRHILSLGLSRDWLSMQNKKKFQTALHIAVLTSQADVVQMLLDAGIDVTRKDAGGNTALHLACREGNREIVDILLKYTRNNIFGILNTLDYEGQSCLQIAATNEHIDIMQKLVANGADVNAIDLKSGRTCLHTACANGQTKVVNYLLDVSKCDINARAYDELTPFDLARARGHSEITLALAVAGARYCDNVE